MRIHIAANASTYFIPLIAVLYQNYVELERITTFWPAQARWVFDQPYGKYNVRVYASQDGVTQDYLLAEFWIDHEYGGKLPRILKDRK